MADSDKPDGEITESEAVSTDDDGNPEIDMEMIEMSEGDGSKDSEPSG